MKMLRASKNAFKLVLGQASFKICFNSCTQKKYFELYCIHSLCFRCVKSRYTLSAISPGVLSNCVTIYIQVMANFILYALVVSVST